MRPLTKEESVVLRKKREELRVRLFNMSWLGEDFDVDEYLAAQEQKGKIDNIFAKGGIG